MRNYILLYLVVAWAAHASAQGRNGKPYLPSDKDQRKLIVAAEDAVSSSDHAKAISLLDSALALNYDHMIDQRRGMLKLSLGDSVGYCSGIQTSALLTHGVLHDRYMRECTRKDSVQFEQSGLDPARFPKVPKVLRTWFRADGRTEHRLIGHDGTMIVGISTLPGDTVFIYSGVMPTFPGGEDSLFTYLAGQMRKDRSSYNAYVVAQFVVEVDGSISNIRTLSVDLGSFCKITKRIISEMPAWEPGRYKGDPVRVRYGLPLRWRSR
ncbi:MAG TPA: hypothetical protein PLE78_01655 [Flavobacteriales bacterium]|nr:hypothetical protein [Flavobacteriales bacterium]